MLAARHKKKASRIRLFVIFDRRCAEMGTQSGKEKVQKPLLFLLGSALGSPGPLQVTKMEPKDAKKLPRDPPIEVFGCENGF